MVAHNKKKLRVKKHGVEIAMLPNISVAEHIRSYGLLFGGLRFFSVLSHPRIAIFFYRLRVEGVKRPTAIYIYIYKNVLIPY